MCGIAGVLEFQSDQSVPIREGKVSGMCTRMRLRGPDGWGVLSRDRITLGHRRLAIVDPGAQSDQPMEFGNWILSYNGEIVNYRAIRRELMELGVNFETNSDTEVLLKGISTWGMDVTLGKVAGMFAFLAFNTSSSELYAVRDHMGIKPLFYFERPGEMICFASSASAIAEEMNLKVEMASKAMSSFMALGGVFTEETSIKGIQRLQPATYLVVDRTGNQRSHKYWTPKYSPEFTMDDLVEIAREYQHSDVSAALFLSGGVDSSFLASIFSNLDTFHLKSPEQQCAQYVANRFNLTMKVVEPELGGFEEDIAGIVRAHGEPLMSCGIPGAVSRAVSESGYKMAISANGADELFLGYDRTPLSGRMPNSFPLSESRNQATFGSQLRHIFRDSVNFELTGDFELPSILELGTAALQRFHLSGFPESANYRWLELMTYVACDLNPTLDAASMYHSLEVRVPFLDHRIVQGVLSWDEPYLVQGVYGRKAPMKEWLCKDLPLSFLNRPKMGFSVSDIHLDKISQMYRDALRRAETAGEIRWNPERPNSFFGRDRIYLSMCFHSFEIWKQQFLG